MTGDCPPYAGPLPALGLPLDGAQGLDWAISFFVDDDPGPGTRDYTGRTGAAARTYDGHTGTDFAIPTFRDMDRGVPVHAVAPGKILATVDGNDDRHTTCTGAANLVSVQLDDGTFLQYLHLRRGSIPASLKPGGAVAAGDVLGLVGSSGCSTWPHVHLELRAASGTLMDPAADCRFSSTLPYSVPFTLMDVAVSATAFARGNNGTGVPDDCIDPRPDATTVAAGGTLGVCTILGGGRNGDRMELVLRAPDGTQRGSAGTGYTAPFGFQWFYWNFALDSTRGTWTVEITIDGALARTVAVTAQ